MKRNLKPMKRWKRRVRVAKPLRMMMLSLLPRRLAEP